MKNHAHNVHDHDFSHQHFMGSRQKIREDRLFLNIRVWPLPVAVPEPVIWEDCPYRPANPLIKENLQTRKKKIK